MPETTDKSTQWTLAIVLLVLALGFVTFAAWYRISRQPVSPVLDRGDGTKPMPEEVQAAFQAMLTDEEHVFRTTCTLCHAMPNVNLYDKAGWEGIGRKMKDRMNERMDVAIMYLMKNARGPFPPPPTQTTVAPAAPATAPASEPGAP